MSEQLIQTPGVFGENGNFLLERELGAGGMGGVYMGRDKMLDRPVAVKVMQKEFGADAEFVEKFKKEAQSAARLIHPNIAQIYSYGICDGMPYIAMELASGGSLYSIMNANPGKTDIARVIKICQQVAQALRCASDQGCVHGDIKPENILLDASGNAKLVDFGLAAMQKDTTEIWGTPYYISPEKVQKEPVDFRADMYSLGGTLYHALTGVAPFEGEDSIAVVKKRFDGAPKKPSEIRAELTPAIDDLVMKMLALDKENRYPSFEALLNAFEAVLTTGLTTAAKGSAAVKPAAGAKRMTTVRGRRMITARRATSLHKAPTDDDSGVASLDEDKREDDDENEEGGGNLGLKVVGVVAGVILLVGAVIGGLVWYQIADKKSRAAEEQRQIAAGTEKARNAIGDTVSKARKYADDFDAFADKATTEANKAMTEIKRLIPEEYWSDLKPGPSKALLEAIALTNKVQAVPAAVPAPASNVVQTASASNAVAKATSSNSVAKASSPVGGKDEKTAQQNEEKPATSPIITDATLKMVEIWELAYDCRAAAIRVRLSVDKVLAKASEASAITQVDRASMDALAALSRSVVDLFDQVKASKDAENVAKWIPLLRKKGESLLAQTTKRLRIEKLENERKAKAEAALAAEKERLEKLAAEKKAKIEEETQTAESKFEMIHAQGCFRQLDWKSAIRQLEGMKSELKTAEGQMAADLQIRKVECMKKMQDIFIKAINGHVFRGKLKGGKVKSVNDREIQIVKADGKSTMKITWQKFYKDYPGNLNELMNVYIVNARQPTAKRKLNLREWTDAMTGAALTMQLVCSEVNGAVERAASLVQEIVKQFPDYLKTAQLIFPDVKIDAEAE